MLWVMIGLALAQVATVDGVPLSEEQFSLQAQRMAAADGQALDRAERLEVVQSLVAEELLYQEARRQGLDQDPKVQKVMVNLLLREQVYAKVRNSDFSDAELEAWFAAHQEEFAVPEKVQVKALTLRVDEGEDPDAVKERLLSLGVSADPETFGTLAMLHSEDPYRRRGGDYGFVPRQGKPGMDPAVVEQAFAQEVGQLSAPVRTASGWALVLTANHRDPVERSYQQMKGAVLRKVKNERIEALYADYVSALWAAAEVRLSRRWLRGQEESLPRPVKPARLDVLAEVGQERIEGVEPEGGQSELEALVARIDQLLLVREALRLGLDQDPKTKKVLVNTLLREQVYSQVRNDDFSDDELLAYFEANKEQFVVPEKVRVRALTLHHGPGRLSREQALSQAELLREQALADPEAFGALCARYSEDPFKRREGELGFIAASGKPGVPPELVEVAFLLAEGQLSAPLVLEDAVVLVRVEARRERVERSFEQMRGSVLRKLENERYAERYEAYVAGLQAAAEVVIDEERMMAVELLPSRRGPASGPGMGPLPGREDEATEETGGEDAGGEDGEEGTP